MQKAQLLTIGLSIGLIGGAAYLMNMFFGLFGAILVTVLTLPVIGIVAYLGGGGGDSGNESYANMSKGARKER